VAEQLFGAILETQPNHGEALHWLGVIAHQKGNQILAIDYLSRAVACEGAWAASWNNLGVFQTLTGSFAEAVSAFEQALRLRPDYAEAYNNLGVALRQRGELERAVACHRQAIRYRPAYAEAYDNLGSALKAQGQWEEAVAAYQQALALQPDFAAAFNNLGIALHEQGEMAQALSCYRQALRLEPGHVDASNNLATLLKEQGLLAEAVAQYRETLRLQPDHALACYNLSQLAVEGWYRFGPDQLNRLKTRLAGGNGSALERSLFCFTLAGVLDQQGATDEAFEYYRQANDLVRQTFQERRQAFDAQGHRALVDQMMAAFDQDYFRRVQGWGLDTELPVFVVGMPRSGSTLVEQILSSHPQVYGAEELGEISRLMARGAKEAGSSDASPQPQLPADRAEAQDLAAGYLRQLARLGGEATRVIDKTLGNYLHLGLIATMFPRARIIHCRRDPRDLGLSCYFQNFQSLNFACSLEDIGAYYREYDRLMAHWSRVLPLPMHEVRYEELVTHPEAVTRSLLAFCGLDWDERCLAFHHNPRAVRTASTLQVRKPLSARAVGRWQRYRSHLEPLLQALGLSEP